MDRETGLRGLSRSTLTSIKQTATGWPKQCARREYPYDGPKPQYADASAIVKGSHVCFPL